MYLSIEQRLPTRTCGNLPLHSVETLLEKGSGKVNEDVLLHDGRLFGVFDGATSIATDDLPAGLTGGLIAARIAARAFSSRGGDTLLDCAQEANRRINGALDQSGIPESKRYRLWSTSAAVIRLGDDHFEYCQTGDSLVLIIRKDGSFTRLVPEINHDRETLRLWKDARVREGVTIHDLLQEQIRSVRMEMNVSYGVLNGETKAMDFIRHGRHSLDGIAAILVFTDGLFLPREDPDRENDWQAFVDLYRQGGLQRIHDHIRSVYAEDPDCRRYPRFKQYDDAAAVAVRV